MITYTKRTVQQPHSKLLSSTELRNINSRGVSRVAKCPQELAKVFPLADFKAFPLGSPLWKDTIFVFELDRGSVAGDVLTPLLPDNLAIPKTLCQSEDRASLESYAKAFIASTLLKAVSRGFEGAIPTRAERKIQFNGGKIDIRLEAPFQWMVDAMQGVEVSRIKLCEHCGLPFWAQRRDKRGCSKEHSHLIAAKKWQERYRAAGKGSYKAQRAFQAKKVRAQRDQLERQELSLHSIETPTVTWGKPKVERIREIARENGKKGGRPPKKGKRDGN